MGGTYAHFHEYPQTFDTTARFHPYAGYVEYQDEAGAFALLTKMRTMGLSVCTPPHVCARSLILVFFRSLSHMLHGTSGLSLFAIRWGFIFGNTLSRTHAFVRTYKLHARTHTHT